jgi:hypothetical protein
MRRTESDLRPADPLRPVFLHGLWRSGSTYVWSRFREQPNALCFYEPLHEGLGRLTRKRIWRQTAAIGSALRHPKLSQPYFAEYEPLLAKRGVRGFSPAFSRDRFALQAKDLHADLSDYVYSLVEAGRKSGRTPVLGFNRTNYRLPWLNRRFNAFNLYVERDPVAVWASYVDHAANGNFSFLKNWLWIIERNQTHPLFAPIARHAPVRRRLSERLTKAKVHYAKAIKRMPARQSYLIVYYLWLTSLIQALGHCDVILDVSAAPDNPKLARLCAEHLRAATGLRVDLSGAAAPPPRTGLSDADRRAAEALALSLLPADAVKPLLAPAVQGMLAWLPPSKRAVIDQITARVWRRMEPEDARAAA